MASGNGKGKGTWECTGRAIGAAQFCVGSSFLIEICPKLGLHATSRRMEPCFLHAEG